ncbi:MAG TPA: heparinase II/III family protein [Caldisericia bacterium]|nr:heparinase II/III family protein [Caldisericia bacterium]
MKRIVLICFLIASFVSIQFVGIHFPSSYSQQQEVPIPLSPHDWQGFGKNSRLIWQQESLLWKPGQKNASMITKSVPRDWSSFHSLSMKLSANQATENWITLLVRDESNHMRFTYFEVDKKETSIKSFPIHDLFSAFGGDSVFHWNKVESLAICTHPSADQNISSLEIQFYSISLHAEKTPLIDPFLFQLTEPIRSENGVLFQKNDLPLLQDKVKQDPRFTEILSYASPNLSKTGTTEHLRNLVMDQFFFHNGDLSQILTQFQEIQPSYWDAIQSQNDIFLQEHAIHYLISIELLRTMDALPASIEPLVQSNILRICEIEQETCLYWIQHYPYGKGNNHVTRAASMLGLSSLYLNNPTNQNQFLQFSLQVLDYYFRFQISEDGVLNEGTHYYTYLLEIFTYFAYGVKNTLGLNLFQDFPFSSRLKSMVDWALRIQKPDGYLPSIDDSWQTRVVFPFRFLIPFFPEQQKEFLGASVCYKNQKPFDNEPWNIRKSLYIPFSLLSAIPSTQILPALPQPQSAVFLDDSQIVFRYKHLSEEMYLLCAGKQRFSLHEQNDAGHIFLSKGDLPLLLESGYGPEGWSSKNRSYYVSHEAHNVFTVDGSGPESWYNGGVGPIDKSTIEKYYWSKWFSFAQLNLPMNIRHPDTMANRMIFFIPPLQTSTENSLFITPGYTLVIDSFHSDSQHTYRSLYHPNGLLHHQDKFGIHVKLPTESDQYLHITTNGEPSIHQETGWFSSYWESEIQIPYYAFMKKERSACIEALISVTEQANSPIVLKRNPSHRGIEYSVLPVDSENSTWVEDLFLLNNPPSMAKGENISSNGTFSFSRMQKESSFPVCYFVSDASYLNIYNQPLFYSPSKIDSILHYSSQSDDNNTTLHYSLHTEQENCTIHFYVPDSISIKKAILDGKEIDFQKKNNKVTISVTSGKHFLTFE